MQLSFSTALHLQSILTLFSVAVLITLRSTHAIGSQEPIIGVMVGSRDIISSEPSSVEKVCIIEALKARYGVNFQIYENHSTLKGSVDAAREMISDQVDFALLPLISDETIAAASQLRAAQIPYLTSATSESVLTNSNTALSLFPENGYQAEILAKLYVKRFIRRPLSVIIDESSSYSKQFSSQFITQLHLLNSPVEINVYNIVGGGFQTIPDLSGHVVVAPLFNPKIALLYRKLRDSEDVIILGGDSIGVRKEFLQIVGSQPHKNNPKLIFLKNWNKQLIGDNADNFLSIFYEGCSRQGSPTFINAYVYEMASLAVEWALKKEDKSPIESIRNSKRKSIMDGESYQFSENGFRRRSYFLYQYIGGTDALPIY